MSLKKRYSTVANIDTELKRNVRQLKEGIIPTKKTKKNLQHSKCILKTISAAMVHTQLEKNRKWKRFLLFNPRIMLPVLLCIRSSTKVVYSFKELFFSSLELNFFFVRYRWLCLTFTKCIMVKFAVKSTHSIFFSSLFWNEFFS